MARARVKVIEAKLRPFRLKVNYKGMRSCEHHWQEAADSMAYDLPQDFIYFPLLSWYRYDRLEEGGVSF